MSRSLLASITLSLALVAAMVPAALAADPTPSGGVTPTATEPAPSVSVASPDAAPSASVAPPDDGTPPDGNISIDPPFITPAPGAGVLAATGRPDPTLPPTDSQAPATDVGNATVQLLLAGLAVLSALLLLVGRPLAARHR